MMLAGGLTPSTEDLKNLYQTEQSRRCARDWLTESADVREFRDRWVSGRDLFLEIVVIGLIGWEIHMGYRQERQQSYDFSEQQKVQTNLARSSDATAKTLTALQTTTETMSKNVERNAKAAEQSSATAAKTLHISERAYLACTVVTIPPKEGEKLRVTSTVTNSGRTTAIEVEGASRTGLLPKGTSEDDARNLVFSNVIMGSPSKSILAPGQTMDQIVDSPIPLISAEVSAIDEGNKVWYLFVEVKYKDIFDHQHSTEACMFYLPAIKRMANCSKFNKAD